MAGVYLVFFIDFFVMRHLKARTANRLAALAVANADSPTESPTSSMYAFSPSLPPSPSTDSSFPCSTQNEKRPIDLGHDHNGPTNGPVTDYASPQAHFDVVILECGIIFHSIMIGVSLGASGGSQWIPLLCAVTFQCVLSSPF